MSPIKLDKNGIPKASSNLDKPIKPDNTNYLKNTPLSTPNLQKRTI